jgi:hypothetical protein
MQCEECGKSADVEAHGWKAFVFRHPEAEEEAEPQVAVFCPECAAREFGEGEERQP